MAVKLSMEPSTLIEKLFGSPSPEMDAHHTLVNTLGAELEIGFFAISYKRQGDHRSVNLPVSSTSLMQGKAVPQAIKQASTVVKQLMAECLSAWDGAQKTAEPAVTGTIKSKPKNAPVSTVSEETLQSIANALGDTGNDVAAPAPLPPKIISAKGKVNLHEVVKLSDATGIGQLTRGTSPGSIYRAVGISPRVNVAVRIEHPNNLSIRVEGKPNSYELGKMTSLGFTGSGTGHWSVHMDCAGLTPARVIGAVLMDMGIQFTEQLKNMKEAQLEG